MFFYLLNFALSLSSSSSISNHYFNRPLSDPSYLSWNQPGGGLPGHKKKKKGPIIKSLHQD